MDVEQRHHAERDVRRRQPVGRGDVQGREVEIAVAKGHLLWPAGRAAGVQHQGDVLRIRVAHGRGSGARSARGEPHRTVARYIGLDERGAIRKRTPCRLGHAPAHDERLGAGVVEIEAELLFLICRVQRRSRSHRRSGQKQHHGLDTVRQNERDRVAAPQAQLGEPVRGLLDHLAKTPVGELGTIGDRDRDRVG